MSKRTTEENNIERLRQVQEKINNERRENGEDRLDFNVDRPCDDYDLGE